MPREQRMSRTRRATITTTSSRRSSCGGQPGDKGDRPVDAVPQEDGALRLHGHVIHGDTQLVEHLSARSAMQLLSRKRNDREDFFKKTED